MWLPFCSSNRALGIEYGNVAGFVTIAFFLVDSLGAGSGSAVLQAASTFSSRVG